LLKVALGARGRPLWLPLSYAVYRYTVERAPQLTAITIKPPKGLAFSDLCDELRELIQPRRDSLTLASTSGRIWSCSNRGNRPGEFVRIL
jgi:hypothetical protein